MEQLDDVAKKLFKGRETDMVQSATVRAENYYQAEPYEVTDDDIRDYFERQGWPTWDSISFEHLDGNEREILDKAVTSVKSYVDAVRSGAKGLTLIILAGSVEGDPQRTGYGCGKTTLATIAHYATSYYYPPHDADGLEIYQRSYIIESRALMARFDDDSGSAVPARDMLIIDDVGREGTLRWEKRDPELQLQEKQDRYYTVIDTLYKKKGNLIITSNMSAKELAAFLGGAAWSRLLEMCPPKFRVNMTGIRDMRPLLGERMGENYGF